jgi:hypothetical protein
MNFKNSVSTQALQSDPMRFFKLERGIENLPSSSILIASLYRQIGLSTVDEPKVFLNSTILFEKINSVNKIGENFNNEELKILFNSALNIPISQLQEKSNKFWITPVIPAIGSFGLSARDNINPKISIPWNPGAFLIGIISNCIKEDEKFFEIFEKLFNSLRIDEETSHDIWSVILQNEFKSICENLNVGHISNTFDKEKILEYRDYRLKKILHKSKFSEILILDLISLLELEKELSRQQWIGLMEAYFRLTMFNHIINTLNLSRSYRDLIMSTLSEGKKSIDYENFLDFINFNIKVKKDSEKVSNIIRTETDTKFINLNIKSYSHYNTFIEFLFLKYQLDLENKFESIDSFINLTNELIKKIDSEVTFKEVTQEFLKIHELSINEISENTGTLKNIRECLEYLGRKKTSSGDYSRYIPDVNYLFCQNKNKPGNPFMFELSPGIISVLTGLIFKRLNGQHFISGLEFVNEIKHYNIELNIKDISEGPINKIMLSLGIIVDSPDTEGGVLIVRPGWVS